MGRSGVAVRREPSDCGLNRTLIPGSRWTIIRHAAKHPMVEFGLATGGGNGSWARKGAVAPPPPGRPLTAPLGGSRPHANHRIEFARRQRPPSGVVEKGARSALRRIRRTLGLYR